MKMTPENLVLLLMLGMLERERIEEGKPSLVGRMAHALTPRTEGNVIDLAFAREGAMPAKWREEALEMIAFVRGIAEAPDDSKLSVNKT